MKKARFAVIGAGGIAQNQHIPNLMRSPYAELKVVCDLDADKLKAAQERFGFANMCTNHKEVLANPEIDAVLIATREDSHAPLTIEALDAGKHVYVEKPLADDEESCKPVTAAQERAGKFVALGFNRRFAPAYVKAKEILKAHGGPNLIHYRISDEFWLRTTRFSELGHKVGHRMITEDCHIADLLRWFTDSEVASVYTMSPRVDEHAICLKFVSGAAAVIFDSGYCRKDLPKEYLEATAEVGCVTVEDFVEMNCYGIDDVEPTVKFAGHTHPKVDMIHKLLFQEDGAHAMRAMRRAMRNYERRLEELQASGEESVELWDLQNMKLPLGNYSVDKGWQWAIDHFAQCVISGETPKTATAYDGMMSAKVIDAAMESARTGEIVRL